MRSSSLPSVPVEVLERILQYAFTPNPGHILLPSSPPPSRKDVTSILLVSHAIHDLVSPLLFDTLNLALPSDWKLLFNAVNGLLVGPGILQTRRRESARKIYISGKAPMPLMEPEDVGGPRTEENSNILVPLDFDGLERVEEFVFGDDDMAGDMRSSVDEGMSKMMKAMARPGGPFHHTFGDNEAAIEERVLVLSEVQRVEHTIRFLVALGRNVVVKTEVERWAEEVYTNWDPDLLLRPFPHVFEFHRTEGEGSIRGTLKSALEDASDLLVDDDEQPGFRMVGFEEEKGYDGASEEGIAGFKLGVDGLWRIDPGS